LARPGGGEGVDPEPFAEDERGPWRDSIRQNAEDVLAELARQVEDLPDPDRDGVMELARSLGLVLEEYTTDANDPVGDLCPAD